MRRVSKASPAAMSGGAIIVRALNDSGGRPRCTAGPGLRRPTMIQSIRLTSSFAAAFACASLLLCGPSGCKRAPKENKDKQGDTTPPVGSAGATAPVGSAGSADKAQPAKPGASTKIGLVFDVGGLGDKSFNDSAHRGLMRAKDELGVQVQ